MSYLILKSFLSHTGKNFEFAKGVQCFETHLIGSLDRRQGCVDNYAISHNITMI